MDECKQKVTTIEELLQTTNEELARYYELNRRLLTIKEKTLGTNPEDKEQKESTEPSNLLQKLSQVNSRLKDSNGTFGDLLNDLEATI